MSAAPPTRRTTAVSPPWLLPALLAGVASGVVLGLLLGPQAEFLAPVGRVFIDALRMLVVPLVFASLVAGVASVSGAGTLGRLVPRFALFVAATTLAASAIGIAITDLLRPGEAHPLVAAGLPERIAERTPPALVDVVTGFVHPNLVQAAAQGQLLPLMVFALALGAALRAGGGSGLMLAEVFTALADAMVVLVGWLMRLAPLGVAALVAVQIGRAGGAAGLLGLLATVASWIGVVVLGLALQATLLAALLTASRHRPARYLRQVSQALVTAFATASSSATLPVAIECVRRAGVPAHVAQLVMPLGSTLNMNGTALYEAAAALFIAQAWGIELDFAAQVTTVFLASLAAVGAAGIPEAGLVTMVMVLTAVGLPVEGIGLLLSVDWLLDRVRTAVNVWGDCVAAAVIGEAGPIETRGDVAGG